MKVSVYKYELKAPFTANASSAKASRSGALLKISWPSGKTGYADLHPWPELGDEKLDDQLAMLEKLRLTPLTEQSIYFAKRDAEARANKESLWRGGVQVRNNFLINDVTKMEVGDLDRIASQGFTTVKLKCGRDFDAESSAVNRIASRRDLFVRLDFNGLATAKTFEKFMSLVHRESDSRVEYVEDPMPYDQSAWSEVQKRWKVAIDFELPRSKWAQDVKPAADVLILKPARVDVDSSVEKAVAWDMGITVTSMMDHAVGVLHAHSIAQELRKTHEKLARTAGCLTFGIYFMDAFSAEVPVQGPFIGKPPGHGVGFDDLWEKIPWKPISER